jgi:hypothetical protein
LRDWRTKFFLWVGLPAIAVCGLLFGASDVGPAWQAKRGGGTAGTFIAAREDCHRRSCSFHGSWMAADGSRTRADVILYDEPDSLRVGGTAEAVDSGARKGVFAATGGSTYLLVTGFTLAGAAAGLGWIVFVLRAVLRRRTPAPAYRRRDEGVLGHRAGRG